MWPAPSTKRETGSPGPFRSRTQKMASRSSLHGSRARRKTLGRVRRHEATATTGWPASPFWRPRLQDLRRQPHAGQGDAKAQGTFPREERSHRQLAHRRDAAFGRGHRNEGGDRRDAVAQEPHALPPGPQAGAGDRQDPVHPACSTRISPNTPGCFPTRSARPRWPCSRSGRRPESLAARMRPLWPRRCAQHPHGRVSEEKRAEVKAAAKRSVGIRLGQDAASFQIKSMIDQMEFLNRDDLQS